MRIYLARHGETVWNAEGLVSGKSDCELSEKGRRQAEELAEKAKDVHFDVIIVSPLKRARDTAAAVARAKGMEFTVDERIREIDFGDFEGTHDGNSVSYWSYKMQAPRRFPNGESLFDVAARVYPFLDEVREKYKGKDVLLVCHGSMGRVVDTYFHGEWRMEELMHWNIGNCELLKYEID